MKGAGHRKGTGHIFEVSPISELAPSPPSSSLTFYRTTFTFKKEWKLKMKCKKKKEDDVIIDNGELPFAAQIMLTGGMWQDDEEFEEEVCEVKKKKRKKGKND